MPHRNEDYLKLVIKAIEDFQYSEFFSDRELSLKAGLSAAMIGKIKSGETLPKLSTLRKLKEIGIEIPRPVLELVGKKTSRKEEK